MSGLSDWLDSCFDQSSEHAPVRAFLFGAVITSVAATIASLASDPHDWRLLVALLGGAIVLGGGCFAMFALPPERFRRLCSLGFDCFTHLPALKTLLGVVSLPVILIAFSIHVGILALLAALHVAYWVARAVFVACRRAAAKESP